MTTKTALKAYVLSAVFGALGGLITIGMIALLNGVINLVWDKGFGMNPHAPERTVMVLPVMLIAGVIVGLLVKRSGKVGGLDEVMKEVLMKGTIQWRSLPKAILTSLISLGSGASLGPEAPSSVVSVGVASFVADKTKASPEVARTMTVSGMSGMLGGMLGSPFLTPAMIAEGLQKKILDISPLLICSMISSAFGVGAFVVVLGKVFSIDLSVPATTGANVGDLLWAFAFGLVGALGALLVFLVHKFVVLPTFGKLQHPVVKAVLAGLLMAAAAYAFPLTMFSGQDTVPHLIAETAQLTALYLIAIALVKMLITTILIDGGFFGGPIFPAIFAGVAFGLAFDHLFGVSLAVAVPAAVGGLVTAVQQRPFTAALLTVGIMGTTSAPVVAIGVSGGLIVLLVLKNLQQKRTARVS